MNVLVGRQAPDFTAKAVNSKGEIFDFSLEYYLSKNNIKGVLLFFYPLNFTFVCPTELVKLHHYTAEFEKRGVILAGISVDSEYSHLQWRKLELEEGGIGDLDYTLISDLSKEITNAYGVMSPNKSVALRAAFFIDGEGIVRHQTINDLPIGRNIEELLRVIDAWKYHEKHGEVCPVDWKVGSHGMKATACGVSDYMTSEYSNNE